MSNDFFGVVALLVILGIGAVAFVPAYTAGGEPVSVVNESVTVDYSTAQSVDESGLQYEDSVTVHNASGDVLDAGTDYEWNETTGDVTFLNSSATTDGESAAISYQYRQTSAEHDAVAWTTNALGTVLTWGLIILGAGYVFREVA